MDEDGESPSIEKDERKPDVCRLWVKLKIPKEGRGEEQATVDINGDQKIGMGNTDHEMNKNCGNAKRVCHICSKEFGSDKALGGHMRIHFQAADRKGLVLKKKLKAQTKVFDFVKTKHGGSGEMFGTTSCNICGKDFPSMKSLFGHMRCHPDRKYRGIHPPSPSMAKNSFPSPSSSNLSDAADPPRIDDQMEFSAPGAVDLTESLVSWPVTAKRGSKAELLSLDDDQFRDAVNYLMMLAQGRSPPESGGGQNFGEVIESKRQMADQLLEVEQRSSNEDGKAVHGNSVKKLDDDDDDDREIKNKKRRKKMKLCDLKPSRNVAEWNKYRCNACDKSFPTHQALGGHTSSHNKFNAAIRNSVTETKEDNKSVVFSNNNAVEAQSSQTSQKVLGIDLNEEPPSEDEAGFWSELACSW